MLFHLTEQNKHSLMPNLATFDADLFINYLNRSLSLSGVSPADISAKSILADFHAKGKDWTLPDSNALSKLYSVENDCLKSINMEEYSTIFHNLKNDESKMEFVMRGKTSDGDSVFLDLSNATPITAKDVSIHVDIDSVIWFGHHLPITKDLAIFPSPKHNASLASNLHLKLSIDGIFCQPHKCLNYKFAECVDFSIYIFLPPHSKESASAELRNSWYDLILRPSLMDIQTSGAMAHYPMSAQFTADLNRNKLGHEKLRKYFVPVECLDLLQQRITHYKQHNPLYTSSFYGITAQNLKLKLNSSFGDIFSQFASKVNIFNESVRHELIYDIGVEMHPLEKSPSTLYFKSHRTCNLLSAIAKKKAVIFRWRWTNDLGTVQAESSDDIATEKHIFFQQAYMLEKEPLYTHHCSTGISLLSCVFLNKNLLNKKKHRCYKVDSQGVGSFYCPSRSRF